MKTFSDLIKITILGASIGLLISLFVEGYGLGQRVFFGLTYGSIAGGALAWLFLPSLIAKNRNHYHKKWIYLLNGFVGPTGLGWIICLLWAQEIIGLPKKKEITGAIREGVGTDDLVNTLNQQGEKISNAINGSKKSVRKTNIETSEFDELEKVKKLHELHNLGAITKEEFETKKAKLLKN